MPDTYTNKYSYNNIHFPFIAINNQNNYNYFNNIQIINSCRVNEKINNLDA